MQVEEDNFLAGASVDADVWLLRPDYRALLIVADGLKPGPSDDVSEEFLRSAEATARELLVDCAVEDLPQVAAWREAYRAFGAKPQRTRNSLEALLRRVEDGLPRVNRLTDTYNAISISRLLPLGGEDAHEYAGSPRLIRATGVESFDTMAQGTRVIEQPDMGEVVWCDEVGVTCRRWNWRQGQRTALRDHTTAGVFILDALDPMSNDELHAAGDALIEQLSRMGSQVSVSHRLLATGG